MARCVVPSGVVTRSQSLIGGSEFAASRMDVPRNIVFVIVVAVVLSKPADIAYSISAAAKYDT